MIENNQKSSNHLNITIILIIVLVIILILGLLVFPNTDNEQADSKLGDASVSESPVSDTRQSKQASKKFAPDFSLQDYDGNTVSLADFKNMPLVVNSWATWCTFCKKEIPDFVEVQKEMDDKVKFVLIGRSEPLKKSKQYVDDLGVADDLIFLLDPNDSFYQSIGGFSMPETLFINKEGSILTHKRGVMSLEEIRERTTALLE